MIDKTVEFGAPVSYGHNSSFFQATRDSSGHKEI
jgi:hypothetical protein